MKKITLACTITTMFCFLLACSTKDWYQSGDGHSVGHHYGHDSTGVGHDSTTWHDSTTVGHDTTTVGHDSTSTGHHSTKGNK